ncbi:MFS transporter [Mycobacterium sp. CPCC 205372]|uniref:MFS transporter n=1 Tax=Mycobacterium hippophais TaxID=3016340 RepID=A0ABT4PU00_9MYCO|nr:MFS transporter [Mycobacterium hippophais]MCZ8380015.1 MFS transporter [Mycobacterium hippophais]
MTSPDADADQVLRRIFVLLAPAIALVVATEFIVVGLLPSIATDLGVPLSIAGRLTAVFAIAAAAAGPAVTLVVGRVPPRALLAAVLVVYAAGNGVVALATDITPMLLARAVQGALLPPFVGLGTAEVLRMAPAASRGRALAKANLGFVLGVLLALPAGIALAQGGNWRLSFVVLAVAPLPVALAMALLFPRSRRTHDAPPAGLADQLALLRRPLFLGHLALSVAIFAAMFSAYTYLGAWFEDVMGLDLNRLALALLLFGAVGVAGNSVAERVADRRPLAATVVTAAVLAIAVNVAAWTGGSVLASVVPLLIWGVLHTAGVTLSQVRVTMAGAEAPAFALTLNISTANLGIAVGAVAGGWGVDRWGMAGLGVMPAALTLAALLLVVALSARPRPGSPRRLRQGQGRIEST